MQFAHADRIDRWLGPELAAQISAVNRGFYGTKPIPIQGLPPGVGVRGDGEFVGRLDMGAEACLQQYRADQQHKRIRYAVRRKQFGGWATDTALQASSRQRAFFQKNFTGTFAGAAGSAWRVGSNPVAGAAAAAAPGGTVPTNATTGAMDFPNSTAGEFRFLQSEMTLSTNSTNALFLIYDRIFAVAKDVSVATTQAVTGVPTRYQSTVQGAENSAENNFLFMEVGATLPATAHNWTVCTYTDQSGNVGATLPSVTGISTAVATRLDMPLATWFCPLADNDFGIQALTQMQMSASLASGAVDFVIGHPIAWIPFIQWQAQHVDERILTAPNFARLYDNACLALLHIPGNSSALTVTGFVGFGQ